ncbi:HAD family hydrolase [uncultured Duncaniella sp.]|jgi:putative hydrolase of the HAD superfamily|uniref:HAD family hydrolase n=1 Tax=uncultured Duncaniella sp. TaxID=2768039 RepID=UPI000F472C65|nr:HAD family hydrolase [uncultured Duncaniella sp.]ROS89246.1 HAD family hydrolase [Muribaculaceae bacterium Isolate-080 (Janvier)]
MGTIESLVIADDVRGIIFDYGGTLDSRGDHWSHIIREAYVKAGVNVAIDDFIDAYVYAERALAADRIVVPGDTFRELMEKKIAIELQRLSDKGCIPESSFEKAGEIAGYCYSHARECVGKSAVVLRKLAAAYPMALVSNFYGNISSVLEDFGIRRYFLSVVESAVVGVRKPDPAIFRLGVEALGLPAADVLVVGDSYGKDIVPARALGCKTFMIEGRQWPPAG